MVKQKVIILLALIVLILGGFYLLGTNQPAPIVSTSSEYITVSGQLISEDLSAMPTDGDGIYKIKADDGKDFEVHLTSGESTCNTEAIRIPRNLKEGSRVESRAKIQNNILRICDPGTYIKGL